MPRREGAPTAGEQATINRLEEELSALREKLHKKDVENNRKKQKNRKKKKRKKESQTGEIFKLCAIICGVVLLVVFCIHDGAYDDFLPSGTISYAYPNQTQGGFVARYLAYDSGMTGDKGEDKEHSVDTSTWYSSAEGITKGTVTEVSQGLYVSTNGSTVDLEDTAYVFNLQGPYEMMFQDLIDGEKAYGSTAEYKTAQEYAREQLKWNNAIGRGKGGSDGYNRLGGPISHAVALKGMYDDYGNQPDKTLMWTAHYGYRKSYDIDLMFVEAKDVDAYYAGEDVPITFIRWTVHDAKAHSGPWGLGQTFIGFSKDALWHGVPGNMDKYYAEMLRKPEESPSELYRRYLDFVHSAGEKVYWWPYVESKVIQTSDSSGPLPSQSAGVFEYYGESYYNDLTSWVKDSGKDWCIVGALVPNWNP